MAHVHTVSHFRWCKSPQTCFCEVNRYFLASAVGAISASVGLWLARRFGSFGVESNAGHDYGDSLYILISAVLASWKHYSSRRLRIIDDIGLWINSLFLIGFGGYVIFQLTEGARPAEFKALPMFGAGFLALVGNYLQFRSLGQKLSGEGTLTHSSTRQHVFYDMMNSVGLMLAAALIFIMGAEVGLIWKCVVAMLLVYIVAYVLLGLGLIDTGRGKWIDYGVAVFFLGIVAIILVINGSSTDVDNVTALMISIAMVLSGLFNLDDRYTGVRRWLRWLVEDEEEDDGHDHHDHHY